jgi:uncharacterized protein (DUF952 family)
MPYIFHITTQGEWDEAQAAGQYRAPSLESQGFIHFSTDEQVTRVADAVYAGQTGLIVLCVDAEQVVAPLRYEPPDPTIPAHHYDGELFPHLYGPLEVDTVVDTVPLGTDDNGKFTFLWKKFGQI